MKYRLATILARENHSSDLTKVIDLNLTDPVSQIVIIHEPYNGSQIYGDGHPAKCITSIELIDGSDVLFSLSGVEAQAADWYHRKQEPANVMLYLNNNASIMIFNLNFGRFLYDPISAFDPSKHVNPQLKITMDVDAGGSIADDGWLTVLAHIFDEKKITPEGFLMHKEIKNYAFAASSHEYTGLPTDHAVRKLFVAGLVAGTGPELVFDTLKLSENNDSRIPFNAKIADVLQAIVSQTRPYREWIIGPGTTTAQNFFCTPTYWPAIAGSLWRTATTPGGQCFYGGDGGRFSETQEGAGPNWQALVEGWCPHGVLEFPFGLQDEIADWYDVATLGSLELDILSASGMSSSESCQIFLQQYRKYAA